MNIIKKYFYNKKLEKEKEKIFDEIFDEIFDIYIQWNGRYISFFDYKYIIITDYENPFLDLIGTSKLHYHLNDKIPLSDILSDKLLNKIKNQIRLEKLKQIL